MKLYSFISLVVMLMVSVACSSDKAEDNPVPMPLEVDSLPVVFCDTLTFEQKIKPIFVSECTFPACHTAGGDAPFSLTNYEEISAKTDIIIPAIEHTGPLKMPRNPNGGPPKKLPQNQIDAIKCWIQAGKPR